MFPFTTRATGATDHAERLEQMQALLVRSEEVTAKAEARAQAAEQRAQNYAIQLTTAQDRIKLLERENSRIPELEAEAVLSEGRVSLAASRMLASTGHVPVDISTPDATERLDMLDRMASLTGAARTKFFQQHKEQILNPR